MWRRPEITRQCFEYLIKMMNQVDHEFMVYCVWSEDWAEELCNEFGFKGKYVKNLPLGRKMNKGLSGLMKYEWDYLMTLGSDDMVNPDLFKIYEPWMNKGTGLIGIDKCWFYKDGECKLVDYEIQIIGAGRLISRKAIEQTATKVKVNFLQDCSTVLGTYNKGEDVYITLAERDRQSHICMDRGDSKFELWDDDISICLDANSNGKLIANRISNKCIDVGETPMIVDIKSEENIWRYEDLDGQKKDIKILENVFGELRQKNYVSN